MKKHYLKLILLFLILSCSKDNPIEEEVINSAPNDFDIEVIDVSDQSATINWNEATDPENDSVTYSIFLNQTLIVEGISELTYQFNDLTELTNYTGKVIAKDANNNETFKTFSFTTEKYYLKYLKLFDYGPYNYGNGYAPGAPYSMIKTNDQNYLIAGKVARPDGMGYQFFVLKIDNEGNEIWKKFYEYEIGDIMTFEITESSNSYILAGYYHLMNIDYDGNLIWYKKIDSYDINYSPNDINSVKVDSNDNIFLVGGRYSIDSKINEGVLTKLDKNGNIIYEKTYKPTLSNLFNNLYIDSGDNLIILGSLDNADYSSGSSSEEIDFWVLKLDNTGQIIWENTFGNARYDFPSQILIKSNGNFVFTGYSLGGYDISVGRIFEIDPEGNELWSVETELSFSNSIVETSDGGFITTGFVDFGNYGALGIYKFDNNGIEEWNKKYQGSSTYLRGISVLIDEDGGYRVAGSLSKSSYSGDEKPKLLIYKTDPEGNYK